MNLGSLAGKGIVYKCGKSTDKGNEEPVTDVSRYHKT